MGFRVAHEFAAGISERGTRQLTDVSEAGYSSDIARRDLVEFTEVSVPLLCAGDRVPETVFQIRAYPVQPKPTFYLFMLYLAAVRMEQAILATLSKKRNHFRGLLR